MEDSEKTHRDAVEKIENQLKNKGCACVRHGNIGGAEPDLACACKEPITLIEVETDKSINSSHTKLQMFIMQEYANNNETRAAVIVTDGTNSCGIPISETGEQLLEEYNLSKCAVTSENISISLKRREKSL